MSSGPAISERNSSPKRRRSWIPPFSIWRYAPFGAILLAPFFLRVWFLWNVPPIAVPFDVDARLRHSDQGQMKFVLFAFVDP